MSHYDGRSDSMTTKSNTIAESSELWRRGFSDRHRNAQVARLVTSLRSIRERVEQLTSRIPASLPGLTSHDISHLDSLWEVASTIAGPDYPLNPLEAYIFGASVLLHDAGLTFESYTGGQSAVRSTLQWRDAHARLSRIHHGKPSELEWEADFEALRALHASQATRLATEPWTHEEHEVYVIDDHDLRENYGALIGQIASSHHWDSEMVERRFKIPRPPPAFLAADWAVDSLKVACLLRVADAGHLDGGRAPSFLLRVLHMNSVSRTHWRAQNKLGRLTVKHDDRSRLVIGSTRPFQRGHAAAWWVAFDLIEVFDRELRRANAILGALPARSRRAFATKGVAGAGQVRELVQYVEVEGWEPTDSTIHVSDVANLVTTLGGEQLYGKQDDRLNVVLRELIQNATDAICVRRSLPQYSGFRGLIVVRLLRRSPTSWVLQVDDDGVGMSSTTLTTDLLDFGRSFWIRERAAREFPGIHASGYTPIGCFGIGFFSIFMAAKEVKVFSRRFDRGLDDVRCLSFKNGVSLRPILSSTRPEDMGTELCTRVELELKPGVLSDPDQITVRCSLRGHADLVVSFEDYVAAMVAGIDVPVVVERHGQQRVVHEGFPPSPNNHELWLRTLAYLSKCVNESTIAGLTRALPRLREIRYGGKCYGLAAIDTMGLLGGTFLSGKAVGGLVNPHSRYGDSFVGIIEHIPATARRDPGEIAAPKETFEEWALEQIRLLKSEPLGFQESMTASYSICELGFDPTEILQGFVWSSSHEITYIPLDKIARMLQEGWRFGFPISGSIDNHLDSYCTPVRVSGLWVCMVMNRGRFNEATLSDGVPSNPNSLIGVVHRVLVGVGEHPKWSRVQDFYTNTLHGPGHLLEVSV